MNRRPDGFYCAADEGWNLTVRIALNDAHDPDETSDRIMELISDIEGIDAVAGDLQLLKTKRSKA